VGGSSVSSAGCWRVPWADMPDREKLRNTIASQESFICGSFNPYLKIIVALVIPGAVAL